MFVCCECCVLSGRGICDELITCPEESYRLCCVVVCDLETSRIGAPYIYDISNVRVNALISFLFGVTAPKWARVSSFTRFLDHTQGRTTVGRTSLDEWSARRRDLYLTTHTTHNRQTSIPPMGFEPPVPANERPQTYALDSSATGTGINALICIPLRLYTLLGLRVST